MSMPLATRAVQDVGYVAAMLTLVCAMAGYKRKVQRRMLLISYIFLCAGTALLCLTVAGARIDRGSPVLEMTGKVSGVTVDRSKRRNADDRTYFLLEGSGFRHRFGADLDLDEDGELREGDTARITYQSWDGRVVAIDRDEQPGRPEFAVDWVEAEDHIRHMKMGAAALLLIGAGLFASALYRRPVDGLPG